MTSAERVSFDLAVALHHEASRQFLRGNFLVAAGLWNTSADYAVSDSAKAVLLMHATEAVLLALPKRTVH